MPYEEKSVSNKLHQRKTRRKTNDFQNIKKVYQTLPEWKNLTKKKLLAWQNDSTLLYTMKIPPKLNWVLSNSFNIIE